MSYLRQMDVEESAMAVAGAGEEAGAGAGAAIGATNARATAVGMSRTPLAVRPLLV